MLPGWRVSALATLAAAITSSAAIPGTAATISTTAVTCLAPITCTAAITSINAPARVDTGREPFVDSRDPPPFRMLNGPERSRFDLGHAVFNTHWVPAGTPRAERRDGVGPLFNADSCDECHNEGARGRGPTGDGPAPPALVVKLDSPGTVPHGHGVDRIYGHVFNTIGLTTVAPEGEVLIHYEEVSGRYPDGTPFSLRAPHYRLVELHYGALDPHTVIEPRIAPAIFGDGLLEAVIGRPAGSFGWQGTAVSIRDQTAQAFAREMGLTNPVLVTDDCTEQEPACREQPNGGTPEVARELFEAVVFFERMLAVPQSPRHAAAGSNAGGLRFASLGCAVCHTPRLTADLSASGGPRFVVIAPYTDLRLHDLGSGLEDEDASGHKVPGRWRTAPLWGVGYRIARERRPTFLHDGRARSVEEAILWHAGEAAAARERFERLPRGERDALIAWLSTL